MLHERLRAFRKSKSLTQQQMADLLAIKKSTYASYEQDISKPPYEIYESMYNIFGLSMSWLLTGEGEIFLPTEEEKKAAPQPSLDQLLVTKEELAERLGTKADKTESERLRQELQSTQEQLADTQEQLRELKSIVHREHNIPDAQELTEPKVPYLTDVAAGPLRATLPQGDYKIPGDKRHLLQGRFSDYFAAKVRGESMSDCIPDGSVVLMRECFVPKEGKVYLFRIDSEFSLKEFGIDAEKELPYLAYCDGSGRRVYPVAEQTCYCVAEFVAVLEKKIN